MSSAYLMKSTDARLAVFTREGKECPRSKRLKRPVCLDQGGDFLVNLGGDYKFPFNSHFQRQISGTLAPGLERFGRELLQRGETDLFVENHNRLLSQGRGRKAQIRTITYGMPQSGRVFLSDAYRSIDDDIVFGEALPGLPKHKSTFKAIGG